MMKEIKPSACMSQSSYLGLVSILMHHSDSVGIQAGGIFVNVAVEKYLRQVLQSGVRMSSQDLEESVTKGVADFEMNAKKAFQVATPRTVIDLNAGRLTVEHLGIRRGRISLDGYTVTNQKSKFDPDFIWSAEILWRGSSNRLSRKSSRVYKSRWKD